MSDLQTELQNLLQQNGTLATKLLAFDNGADRLLNITQNAGRIKNAIKYQRWFFFKNKLKVLFDRATSLLWANLDYFPYKKEVGYYSIGEVQDLINSINSNGIDGFTNWRIPTPSELLKLVEDTTFPYYEGGYGRRSIKGFNRWCVYYNGSYQYKDLDDSRALTDTADYGFGVILCSDEVHMKDYKAHRVEMQAQYVLNMFIKNKLEPFFNDVAISDLYRQIYVEGPDVQKKFAEVHQKLSLTETYIEEKVRRKAYSECLVLTLKSLLAKRKAERFDLVTLEKNFGDGADTSPIRYALSVKNLTEYLSMKFGEYVTEKAAVLAELQKLPAAPKFIPNIKKLRADLNNFHADALKIYSSFIDAENLHGLYNLYKESYPPFSIVAETLTEKIRQVILRVEIFEVMPNFLREICAEVTKKFNGNDKIKPYFDAVTEIYSNLFSYVLEGHLRQEIVKKAAAERVLEILTTYRKSLDNIKIDPCVKGSSLPEMRESKELNNIQIQGEIARCGKICKNSLKEIEESLTDETEKRWLRINCIEKISG